MPRLLRYRPIAVLFGTGLMLAINIASADDVISTLEAPGNAQAQSAAVSDYWTADRMREATPMPTPHVTVFDTITQSAASSPIPGDAGFVQGHRPGGGPYTPKVQLFTQEALKLTAVQPQVFSTPGDNPRTGPYGPFQRFSMHGKYKQWPRYVHGKLFFSSGGGNFVCSGTVIGRSTIATAGHCVSDGAGTFASNFLFCPAWNRGGAAQADCWSWASVTISTAYHTGGDPDQDYACIVAAELGNEHPDKIGNLTGWAGYAWNWGSDQPAMTFGYPAAAPFDGNLIQQTASVEWYTLDFRAGGPQSKFIGSDLGPGSSGGGWFISWRHPKNEFADTDDSSATDPSSADAGPFLNGVNSHSRCLGNCDRPPTDTNGVFWQEMSSPQFLSTAAVDGDVREIFSACLDHLNND